MYKRSAKKKLFYVIVARHEPRYIANDGSKTNSQLKAAKFKSISEAVRFAEWKRVCLDTMADVEAAYFEKSDLKNSPSMFVFEVVPPK